jgi:glycosyltransferase involved in cell wall biosynthesis
MNIGIVVPYFTPYVRGNEYGLAQGLTRLGHNITIITSTAKAPREKAITDTVPLGNNIDFDVRYLPVLINMGDNPIVSGVKDHVREQDIVMLQEDYPLICHKAYSAAREYDIPVILSSERTFSPENIAKRYALKLLDATTNRKLRNGADALTAHCIAAKEFIIEELGVKREITVIHVGVDTDLFRPQQQGRKYLTKGDFRILTVARLHRYKGLEYLVEAMEAIRKEIQKAHLYILGKGGEEQNLKSLVNKLQLDDAVTFLTKPVPNQEIPQLYAECDIYVQPSIVEPYGIAVVEAMACGKPVVGTKVGGMRDTVLDKETGFLVKPWNPAELAGRITMLRDDELRRELGARARARVEKGFDWKYIASRYQELIDVIA